jgi:tetratricopeptide (TPR) repeat protein
MDQADLLQAIAVQDAIVQSKQDSDDLDDQRDVAYALLSRARLLGELSRADEAIRQFADVRATFSQSADEFLRASAAASWVAEGYLLDELGRHDAALAAFDGALAFTAGSSEPMLQEQAISAFYRKALNLRNSGRYGDAMEAVAELLNRFLPAPSPGAAPNQLAPARSLPELAQAALLFPLLAGDLGQADRAIPMYDTMIAIFGDEQDTDVREAVGRARLSKAALLGRNGHLSEAIELCREVLSSIDDSREATFETLRAMSLVDQGVWLKAAGSQQEATSCFREVVDGFSAGRDDEIDAALDRAHLELTG